MVTLIDLYHYFTMLILEIIHLFKQKIQYGFEKIIMEIIGNFLKFNTKEEINQLQILFLKAQLIFTILGTLLLV